ncbi:hypothetical protein JTE90_027521 [Oedothorax gibbosus]|uniref:MYND-type domain-containing protein n=1 Tax=Oedothorax gibbosus TaxID=931172 RepID=A0AAV6VM35_9ARAC|nr:hypothetical protein JTE90_027521 [Oedothorax gibbosus]
MPKRLHELALPKGNITPDCEICGKKATTKCEECRVTHYCGQEHKQVDAISFHKTVCDKMKYIKAEHLLPFTETDRIALEENIMKTKQEVMSIAETTTRKWLLERKPVNAYPSAMICWNMACEMESPNSEEVILPICQVAEVFLKLGETEAATEYMVQASWISQNYETLPPVVLAKLHRLRGIVLMANKKWSEARRSFAEFVYITAVEYGITNIRMGIPYGLLGVSLLKLGNVPGAMASFHKMADKWLDFLLSQFKEKLMRTATENDMANDKNIQELEFQYLEGKFVFEQMYEVVRGIPMHPETDLINFKILCFQAMCRIREGIPKDSIVFKEEALVAATRTRQDSAVSNSCVSLLTEVLGEDYLLKWDKKNKRPRTVATKYLEKIQAINV